MIGGLGLFQNINLVSAVNNIPEPSYPLLYSSVISVAAQEGKDPFTFYYNPNPRQQKN
jgi:hypothetical protein